MGHVGLFEPQTHRTNKSFVFWGLSCEVLSHKADFVDSSLPAFSFSLSRSDDLKHLGLSHRFNFFDRHRPFASFFLSLLFDHVSQHFRVPLLVPIHQIGRHCSILNVLNATFRIFLLMLFYRLFHLYLLFEPFLVEKFSFNTFQGLCLLGNDLCFSGLFLSSLLLGVHSFTEASFMQIHIIVLRHFLCFFALLKGLLL